MKVMLLVGGMCLGTAGGAFAQTSGAYSASNAHSDIANCPAGLGGHHEYNGGDDCPYTDPFTGQVETDADAQNLSFATESFDYPCNTDEVDSTNDDGNCMDEAITAFDEVGLYTVIKWKLYFKKILDSDWVWKLKEKHKSKKLARLDEYCGSSGVTSHLMEWLTSENRVCGANFCDNTFSATNMPNCNADCDSVAATVCVSSCDFADVCSQGDPTQYCIDSFTSAGCAAECDGHVQANCPPVKAN